LYERYLKNLPEIPGSLLQKFANASFWTLAWEQDALLGRPKAPLNVVIVYLLTVLTVYPELTPGKQYVTF
jgi:hypothetical protein